MLRHFVFALAALTTTNTTVSAQEHYAARTNWADYSYGYLNLSVFVFRDLNVNGVYDLGDKPFSGIFVSAASDREPKEESSNLSGFANFRMSGTDATMEITFPGKYHFVTEVPPNWSVTTGNQDQVANLMIVPGTPADMIAEPTPTPVGLAPKLSISGSFPDAASADLEITSPDGKTSSVKADATGRYAFPAERGSWAIRAPGIDRQVDVSNAPLVLSSASVDVVRGGSTLVTFDDLLSEGIMKVPSGYKGLNWGNVVMTHQKFYGAEGYRNNVISGEFLAYNGSGHPAFLERDEPFSFVGGFFGASISDGEGETLHIKAWRGNRLAYEQDLTLSALGPLYFAADFEDVTRIEFATEHHWQATFDDLEFRLPPR